MRILTLTLLLILFTSSGSGQSNLAKQVFDNTSIRLSTVQSVNRLNRVPLTSIGISKRIPITKRYAVLVGFSQPLTGVSDIPRVSVSLSIKLCC